MAAKSHPSPLPELPQEPVQRLTDPVARFLHIEAASGVLLLVCTAIALVAANSVYGEEYLAFWHTKVGFEFGPLKLDHYLQHWVNDGLMVIFFFVVGLEVKRELVLGELRDVRRAALPFAAALGGMIVPAAIYLAMQSGQEGARGWGIPMATDIAFVVGCLALMGPRVPHGLRILLLSLAIVDDIGAILVIAVGYTEHIDLGALGLAAIGVLVIVALAWVGVRNIGVYTICGVLVWLALHESGVHATIAGVVLGLITPTRRWVGEGLLGDIVHRAEDFLQGEQPIPEGQRYDMLRRVEKASREALSPLERLETGLHPWVGFVIMPIFALANAGVPLDLEQLAHPVSLAVMAGLVLGKPIGVVLASWLVVRAGIARLPEGVNWGMIVAGGFLAGIGFTMAIFIANLALQGELLVVAKIGILAASVVAATIGMLLLAARLPKRSNGDAGKA